MSNKKDSFIFKDSYKQHFELLGSDTAIKELLFAVIEYHANGTLPDLPPMAQMAFSFIKADLDKNMKNYEMICNRNKNNGLKGGRPHKQDVVNKEDKPKKPSGISETQWDSENPVGAKKADMIGYDMIGDEEKNTPLPPKGDCEKTKIIQDIYLAYPKHCKEVKALASIARALKTIDADALLAKVKEYAIASSWQDMQFIPDPDSWFMDKRWTDDPETWAKPEEKKSASIMDTFEEF